MAARTTRRRRRPLLPNPRRSSPAWWLLRDDRTRSHPELGRQTSQRPWYCVSRPGRVGRRQARQDRRCPSLLTPSTRRRCNNTDGHDAGWSSPVARQAHNLKAAGSNPAPATTSHDTQSSAPRNSAGPKCVQRHAQGARGTVGTRSPARDPSRPPATKSADHDDCTVRGQDRSRFGHPAPIATNVMPSPKNNVSAPSRPG